MVQPGEISGGKQVSMAITFLGYLDTPEEHIPGGKKRCLFGCESASDVAGLPTEAGFTLYNGSRTAAPAPFSYAIVKGGAPLVLDSTGSWGAL